MELGCIPWSDPREPGEGILRARQIVFEVSGREFPLGPGDRLLLPAGVAHRARAGPDGARYLIGLAASAIQ